MEIMLGPGGTDGDHPWHRLERGEIPLRQARDAILDLGRSQHDLEVDIYRFFNDMPRDGGIRQQLVERVRHLRRDGYSTALLTNNIREFGQAWRAMLPVEELFDLVVDSSEEGVRKPDHAIFRLTLERLGGVPPRRALFLDDFEGNLIAAEAVGMQTIHVGTDISEAIDDLDRLLSA
jgi:epoxide hydrolase-like predicted phosphatase